MLKDALEWPITFKAIADRICSIKERYLNEGGKIPANFDASLLVEDSAHKLINLLSDFESIVTKCINDNEPCYLCNYALELAKAFSKCYLDLKVVGTEENIAQARLSLFDATSIVLRETLRLLGIEPITRM